MSVTWIACRVAAAVLAGALAFSPAGHGANAMDPPPPERPIIAELFWNAEGFHGRLVVVYGLVIETADAGRAFMLQDVSQMPLRVEITDGTTVWNGEQLLVEGLVVQSDGEPTLKATRIVPTKVLGGGGCC